MIKFKHIKSGEAFRFDIYGAVFVKCRDGFRPGLGGQLHSCQPNVSVYRYPGTKEKGE